MALLAARTEAIKRLRKDKEVEGNDAVIASKLVAYCSEQVSVSSAAI